MTLEIKKNLIAEGVYLRSSEKQSLNNSNEIRVLEEGTAREEERVHPGEKIG